MTPDDKEFIVHLILFWVMLLIIALEEFFEFMTDKQFAYLALVWLVAMCATSLYRWHSENKD